MNIMQFELWQECNNKCSFCYLGKNVLNTPKERKLQAIEQAYQKISDNQNYPHYDCLAFIGGEFFQGQLRDDEVRHSFFLLMRKAADLANRRIIKEVWISATLTIGNQADLFAVIDLFDDPSQVWILTSWDSIGRFHSPKMEQTWRANMKRLKEVYPTIKLNTTIILTAHFISLYLADKFDIERFSQEYQTSFFFKQCGSGESFSHLAPTPENNLLVKQERNKQWGDFFPERKQFMEFLCKFRQKESLLNWTKLFNIHYRADDLYRNFNDKSDMELTHRYKDTVGETNEMGHLPCGHLMAYDAYVDQPGCVLCDKHKVEQLFE